MEVRYLMEKDLRDRESSPTSFPSRMISASTSAEGTVPYYTDIWIGSFTVRLIELKIS